MVVDVKVEEMSSIIIVKNLGIMHPSVGVTNPGINNNNLILQKHLIVEKNMEYFSLLKRRCKISKMYSILTMEQAIICVIRMSSLKI